NDRRPGRGVIEHQGRGTEKDAHRNRGGAPWTGADCTRPGGGLNDRGLGPGVKFDLEAVRVDRDQVEVGRDGGERALGDRQENLAALDERSGTGGHDPERGGAAYSVRPGGRESGLPDSE